MDEKTALDELQFIRKVIDESKRAIVYNGMDYIVWGILVITGMILTYVFLLLKIFFNFIWIWVILISIGWIFSFYSRKKEKQKQPDTFSQRIIATVWIAAGIGMTIIGFVGSFSGAVKGAYISPILCVILGMAYLVTGTICGEKWISYLSIGWWSGALVLFFFTGTYSLLIMALLMLFFQTIPGIIIYRNYKREVKL